MTCRHYFQEISVPKAFFYTLATLYVALTSLAVVIEPFLSFPCMYPDDSEGLVFENNLYHYSACDTKVRRSLLMGLTREECVFGRRLVASVIFGIIIGYERNRIDRAAGIRTAALVSLGSCLFTTNSLFAFLAGPETWDSSRVAAALPSAIGFVGSGLIVKHSEKDDFGESHHFVRGLSTGASVWLSAAVGCSCGGGLYFPALFSTAAMLIILRFGPRGEPEFGVSASGSVKMTSFQGKKKLKSTIDAQV